jgi:hypothetical protein
MEALCTLASDVAAAPDPYPAPPRFVGDCYATLRQQIFDIAEARYEPKIEPNRLLIDLRRESVSGVVDLRHHLGYRADC